MSRKYRMHVHGPTMARNHALGDNRPVVCLRPDDDPELAIIVREVAMVGPVTFVHRPGDPLPNTAGKAVAWVEAWEPIYVLLDSSGHGMVQLTDELANELGIRGI